MPVHVAEHALAGTERLRAHGSTEPGHTAVEAMKFFGLLWFWPISWPSVAPQSHQLASSHTALMIRSFRRISRPAFACNMCAGLAIGPGLSLPACAAVGGRAGLHSEPSQQKSLSVALAGATNAGKSSLLSSLVGQAVAPSSRKANTTVTLAAGVHTQGSTQLVIRDTPGWPVGAGSGGKLPTQGPAGVLTSTALAGLHGADVVAYVVDVARKWTDSDDAGFRAVAQNVAAQPGTLLLGVLNKCDLLTGGAHWRHLRGRSKEQAQRAGRDKLAARYDWIVERMEDAGRDAGLPHVASVDNAPYPVLWLTCASAGTGVPELRAFLAKLALPKPWAYPPAASTDQSNAELVMATVRAKLLDNFHAEVPYLVALAFKKWAVTGAGSIALDVDVVVPKDTHAKILKSRRGAGLRAVQAAGAAALGQVFGKPVSLYLHVKVSARAHARGDTVFDAALAVAAQQSRPMQLPASSMLHERGMQAERLVKLGDDYLPHGSPRSR